VKERGRDFKGKLCLRVGDDRITVSKDTETEIRGFDHRKGGVYVYVYVGCGVIKIEDKGG
jgi:hypothetical protein